MDVRLIMQLNELWQPIYPYLADWVQRWCPEKTGWILEMGPFSGGISNSLMNNMPHLETICLVQKEDMVGAIRNSFPQNKNVVLGALNCLPFRSYFDLIIFRGAFFFLTPKMIKESYRALRPGGHALIGGGYGPLTPKEEIDRIAEESKRLNYRLGKKSMPQKQLIRITTEAGLDFCSTIIEEGGIWLLVSNHSENKSTIL